MPVLQQLFISSRVAMRLKNHNHVKPLLLRESRGTGKREAGAGRCRGRTHTRQTGAAETPFHGLAALEKQGRAVNTHAPDSSTGCSGKGNGGRKLLSATVDST